MIDFKVIETGSKANAFLVGSVMFDVGTTYKAISDIIEHVDVILLSHVHGDHFKKSTVKRIARDFPYILFAGGDFMRGVCEECNVDNFMVIDYGKSYEFAGVKVMPILLKHDIDVLNYGYRIRVGEYRHLHATDTADMNGIKAFRYDSCSVEVNHEEESAEEDIKQKLLNGQYAHMIGAKDSHLSVQQTLKFMEDNEIKKLIPVHVGKTTEKEVFKMLDEYEADGKIEIVDNYYRVKGDVQ